MNYKLKDKDIIIWMYSPNRDIADIISDIIEPDGPLEDLYLDSTDTVIKWKTYSSKLMQELYLEE